MIAAGRSILSVRRPFQDKRLSKFKYADLILELDAGGGEFLSSSRPGQAGWGASEFLAIAREWA